jgi:hypothetical protein
MSIAFSFAALPAWDLEGTLQGVLRVAGDPTATITGAQGSQVQLETGLGCTKGKTDLVADSRPILS